MRNSSNLIAENVKPVSKIEEISPIMDDITEEQLEAWRCKTKVVYKTHFIHEFNDYPYNVLDGLALKTYGFIKHNKLKFHSDEITLSVDDIIAKFGVKKTAAYNAIKNLLANKIIFKTDYKDVYYINVLICFKGNIKYLIDNRLKTEKLL